MNLRVRLLAGVVVLLQLGLVITADSNLTAFNLQSPNLNTSPFRGYDDRPADCPPWYLSHS